MAGLRVLVADDDAACVESIKAVLPPQFQIIAAVRSSDSRALSRTALKLRPDVILIRFRTATPGGFQAVTEIFQSRLIDDGAVYVGPNLFRVLRGQIVAKGFLALITGGIDEPFLYLMSAGIT